jgi:hypothetical protein
VSGNGEKWSSQCQTCCWRDFRLDLPFRFSPAILSLMFLFHRYTVTAHTMKTKLNVKAIDHVLVSCIQEVMARIGILMTSLVSPPLTSCWRASLSASTLYVSCGVEQIDRRRY